MSFSKPIGNNNNVNKDRRENFPGPNVRAHQQGQDPSISNRRKRSGNADESEAGRSRSGSEPAAHDMAAQPVGGSRTRTRTCNDSGTGGGGGGGRDQRRGSTMSRGRGRGGGGGSSSARGHAGEGAGSFPVRGAFGAKLVHQHGFQHHHHHQQQADQQSRFSMLPQSPAAAAVAGLQYHNYQLDQSNHFNDLQNTYAHLQAQQHQMLVAMAGMQQQQALAQAQAGANNNNNKKGQREFDETNVYVSHLPQNMTHEEFFELMSRFGTVVSSRILAGDHWRSKGVKGVGFARMATEEEALGAVKAVNEVRLPGAETNLRGRLAFKTVRSAHGGPQENGDYGYSGGQAINAAAGAGAGAGAVEYDYDYAAMMAAAAAAASYPLSGAYDAAVGQYGYDPWGFAALGMAPQPAGAGFPPASALGAAGSQAANYWAQMGLVDPSAAYYYGGGNLPYGTDPTAAATSFYGAGGAPSYTGWGGYATPPEGAMMAEQWSGLTASDTPAEGRKSKKIIIITAPPAEDGGAATAAGEGPTEDQPPEDAAPIISTGEDEVAISGDEKKDLGGPNADSPDRHC